MCTMPISDNNFCLHSKNTRVLIEYNKVLSVLLLYTYSMECFLADSKITIYMGSILSSETPLKISHKMFLQILAVYCSITATDIS